MTYDDIYDYMIEVMPQYTDFVTDEVNTTFLAEDACNHEYQPLGAEAQRL